MTSSPSIDTTDRHDLHDPDDPTALEHGGAGAGEASEPTPDASAQVEVRRNGGLSAALGVVAALVAVLYLARAVGGGTWVDWALLVVTGAIAAAHLQALADARVPLLVVDDQGARLRRGRSWRGLPWDGIESVEHEPRRGLFRDGRIVLVPLDPHGHPFVVPLSLSTRVVGDDGDLTEALARLAPEPDLVVEVVPDDHEDDATEETEETEETGEHQAIDGPDGALETDLAHEEDVADEAPVDAPRAEQPDPRPEPDQPRADAPRPPLVASPTPLPLRAPVAGVRAEVRSEPRFEGAAALSLDPADASAGSTRHLPEAGELRRGDQVAPLPVEGVVETAVTDPEPVVIVEPEPVADPVVGPQLAAARTRLHLTVDQLADRTRIRPHVIESIEIDDFVPCGGDFYARGHLRTLARVLGVDAAPLLAAYDERYADAPIDARRVFEAELATAADGPIRGTRGGPNWSVLVAAVMAVVLAWSIVRLVMDSPVELHHKPVLNGSPSAPSRLGAPVPVVVSAPAGGAHVVVRDGGGAVVFNGDIAYGGSKAFKASPPVRVQTSDGSVQVTVDGTDRGPLGTTGQPAQSTFTATE